MGIENLTATLDSLYNTSAQNAIAKLNVQAKQAELETIKGAKARGISSSGAFETGMAKTLNLNRGLAIGDILASLEANKSNAISNATVGDYMSDKQFGQQKEMYKMQRDDQMKDLLRDTLVEGAGMIINPFASAASFNTYMQNAEPGLNLAKNAEIFG